MIIMLAGRTKAGKSTLAEIIVQMDITFKQVAFADILKEDYSSTFDVPLEVLRDVNKKELYRFDLVAHADARRIRDRYYYARGLFEMLDAYPEDNYVIDDLRTMEELELGLLRGATPHKVQAEVGPRKARGWKQQPCIDDHYTETEMDLSAQTYRALNGGTVINNNTQSLDDLRNRAYTLLKDLKNR